VECGFNSQSVTSIFLLRERCGSAASNKKRKKSGILTCQSVRCFGEFSWETTAPPNSEGAHRRTALGAETEFVGLHRRRRVKPQQQKSRSFSSSQIVRQLPQKLQSWAAEIRRRRSEERLLEGKCGDEHLIGIFLFQVLDAPFLSLNRGRRSRCFPGNGQCKCAPTWLWCFVGAAAGGSGGDGIGPRRRGCCESLRCGLQGAMIFVVLGHHVQQTLLSQFVVLLWGRS